MNKDFNASRVPASLNLSGMNPLMGYIRKERLCKQEDTFSMLPFPVVRVIASKHSPYAIPISSSCLLLHSLVQRLVSFFIVAQVPRGSLPNLRLSQVLLSRNI